MKMLLLTLCLSIIAFAESTSAQLDGGPNPAATPQFNPDNGHSYLAVSSPWVTWDQAKGAAEGLGGYLATVTSRREQDFIVRAFPFAVSDWSGYWLGGVQPADDTVPDVNPSAGWQWVTGEPLDPNLWTVFGAPFGEPNDCACSANKEDALQLWANGAGWNDLPRESGVGGFIVEFEGGVPAPPSPPHLAYEGFDYPGEADLTGQGGGIGWITPWGVNRGGISVVGDNPGDVSVTGSLEYIDTLGNTLVTSGNHAFYSGQFGISNPFRDFDLIGGRGDDFTTTWISLMIQRVGPMVTGNNPYPRSANIAFFDGRIERFGIGNPTGAPDDFISIQQGGSLAARRPTATPFDQLSFVVLRIDHLPGNDNAWLFVNPILSAEPMISAADAQTLGEFDFSFNRARPYAKDGDPAQGFPYAELILDELRIGNSYQEVAPYAAPVRIRVQPEVINLSAKGAIGCVIFGSGNLNVTAIELSTLKLAGAPVRLKTNGTPMAALGDVDGDGHPDLIVHVDTTQLELQPEDTQIVLRGATETGLRLIGEDVVRIVP